MEIIFLEKLKFLVQGIVQGVGFRPTVYRIAKKYDLNGYVRNLGNIVEIILEGRKEDIISFKDDLLKNKPPLAEISSIKTEYLSYDDEYSDFTILESVSNYSGASIIPPDMGTCDACLSEINNPNDRHYKYPFTACTDCGPRFTVINSTPYDRERTSMDEFPLCDDCMVEYTDVSDRRYHAEAICCPICGPEVILYKGDVVLDIEDPIKEAAHLLDEGQILAIKGIGGTHLVAKVTDENVVQRLRERLGRLNQPFACMSPDIETVKMFCEVSDAECETLISQRRPIVVLKKNENYNFAENVAPDLHNIGIMLPYSGLQHLLFQYTNEPAYIMTSANMPGEPMLIDNENIIKELEGIADYYLLHNRKIINRCDDSVVRYRGDDMAFIRRSRGYVPEPYDLSKLNNKLTILSLGPEIDVTFSLLKEGKCYLSQHIGNTNKFATLEYMKDAIKHMLSITHTETINIIVCDMHPQFHTTHLAKELQKEYNCELLQVQHHHAHGMSLMIDNNLDEMICIAADGVGYGDDGKAWGGEILYLKGFEYERIGCLMAQDMPGGDLCAKYPARMLIPMLNDYYSEDELKDLLKTEYLEYFPHGETEIELIFKQLERGINVGVTTSTGRVLDAISVALKINGKRTYEGEGAMKLESVAFKSNKSLNIDIEINNNIINTSKILNDTITLIQSGESQEDVACASQKAVAEGLAMLAVKSAKERNVKYIGGTGGVFYNEAISLVVKEYVEKEGFIYVQHRNTCAGDGSVSLGQAAIGALKFSER